MSRIEYLLNALINEDDVKDFEPQSRCEAILKSCCTGEECNIEPESRIEALLKILYAKGIESGGSGGGSAEEEWFNDGNTHLWISLPEGRTSPAVGVGVNGTVTVDWGDGTTPDVLTGTDVSTVVYTPNHNYASAGDYIITLTVDGEMGIVGLARVYSRILSYTTDGSKDNRNRAYLNKLLKIELGKGVTSIDAFAFARCSALTSINIPDGVESIGPSALLGCSALTSINIPDGVERISDAFTDCYGLAKIRFERATPPLISYNSAFDTLPADCIISVPVGCLEAYTTATNCPDPNTYTYVEE